MSDQALPAESDHVSFAADTAGPSLLKRAAAEALGDAVLLLGIVGAPVFAARVASDGGVAAVIVGLTAALALGLMVHLTAPVSGGHLNPAVSLASWWLRQRGEEGLDIRELGAYVAAQIVGAIVGVLIANALWDLSVFTTSDLELDGARYIFAEVIATLGLVFVVFALARTGRAASIPVGLFAWVLAASAFTPSGAFANPAVTIGRWFTEAPAGLAGSSVPGFLFAQILGAILALILVYVLFGVRRTR